VGLFFGVSAFFLYVFFSTRDSRFSIFQFFLLDARFWETDIIISKHLIINYFYRVDI